MLYQRPEFRKIIYRQGPTFAGPVSATGLVLLLFSAVLAWADYTMAALIISPPSLFCLMSFKGTIIDTDRKQIKKWTSILGIRSGYWHSLGDNHAIELRYFSVSRKIGMRSSCHALRTQVFEIWITSPAGKNMHIIDVPDYETAKAKLGKLSQQTGFNQIDRYEGLHKKAAFVSKTVECERH